MIPVVLLLGLLVAGLAYAEPESYSVRASTTDPRIKNPDGDHLAVIDRGIPAKNILVLWLGGTDSQPSGYTLISTEAAKLGYHVVSLSYPNSDALGALCGNDRACYKPARLEVIDGIERSSVVSVDAWNSINFRTIRLLQYLRANHPSDGWAQFLDASERPAWAKITLAGHSQGGGFAGLYAKLHALNRAVMIAAPVDAGMFCRSAYWILETPKTPVAKQCGFMHEADPFECKIRSNWMKMGLTQTTLSNVEVSSPHSAVAHDSWTPLDSAGAPVYGPLWRNMFGE